MSNVFFSSDWHLGHSNIAGQSISQWKEGFRNFEDLYSMNECIITNINNTVSKNDIIYFLGDFCFGDHRKTPEWRSRINCKTIYWIKGNHDKKQEVYKDNFTWVGDVKMVDVDNQKIFLSHYSHRIWEGSHKGYWHLFGHSHGSLDNYSWGKSMDVGIDSAYSILEEYRPFSFDEIKQIMDGRNTKFVDHHDANTNVR